MYDKIYADRWIKNHESGQDIYRRDYLEPYVQKYLQKLSSCASILDVGCGWGMLLAFVGVAQTYVGIDPTEEFFSYIKSRYTDKNITLYKGSLPFDLPLLARYDFVFCAMTLHCVANSTASIARLSSYAKKGGRVLIIDFNDVCLNMLRDDVFVKKEIDKDTHISGIGRLPSGVEVDMEVFFHTETDMEKILSTYGTFYKEYVGPYFVAYNLYVE